MNSRLLPPVAGFFDRRAPVSPPRESNRLPNPVSIMSMLNTEAPTRLLGTRKHSFNPVSIASMLNAEAQPPNPPRLILTGVDIPECDIPELEIGSLGEPAVKFTSVNKGPNHFPSHTEDLELLVTSTRAYRFEPPAIMEALQPSRSEMGSQRNLPEDGVRLKLCAVPFINRYRPARFSVGSGPSNNQQLSQRSGYENGRSESSKLGGVWPFSGILRSRRFQVRSRRPWFGSKKLRGETLSGLAHDTPGPALDLHTIRTRPSRPRLAVSSASDFGSFWDGISDTVVGGRCMPLLPVSSHDAPITRFQERTAMLPLTLRGSEFGSTDPWEEQMSDW